MSMLKPLPSVTVGIGEGKTVFINTYDMLGFGETDHPNINFIVGKVTKQRIKTLIEALKLLETTITEE